ncbi:hypothetical protein ACLOJK_024026, partial [Asimina triloba]
CILQVRHAAWLIVGGVLQGGRGIKREEYQAKGIRSFHHMGDGNCILFTSEKGLYIVNPAIRKLSSINELDLSRASSSGAICEKDIALAINSLIFLLSITMPPRKVPHAIPSPEIKEEQPIFHQLGKGGLPFFVFSH